MPFYKWCRFCFHVYMGVRTVSRQLDMYKADLFQWTMSLLLQNEKCLTWDTQPQYKRVMPNLQCTETLSKNNQSANAHG